MACRAVTTWRGRELTPGGARAAGTRDATGILDWTSLEVAALDEEVSVRESGTSLLRVAYRSVQHRIRAVYALDDTQPTSRTIARARGSCSQRLAVVESLARRNGVATRVEGLVLRGEFWYPRFRCQRPLVPDRVLIAWPSFHVDGEWIDASAAFSEQGCTASAPFTNSGAETLFDAAGRSPISWSAATTSSACLDLSDHVVQSLGTFDSRDDLFARYGQTLARPVRTVLEPFWSRWGAG
ncbi:hypothetical protein [Rhodococcus sp. NPDC059234]|uniref:hypothetical protein n=1 Tax=Rhodococcus sp. NPDC059234 TaxID=3346781 RepID=UPI00366DAF18